MGKNKKFKECNETLRKLQKIKNVDEKNIEEVKKLSSLLLVDCVSSDYIR